MAAKSSALPRKEESLFVFSQREDWDLWKLIEIWSSLTASIEAGSIGARPPEGEQTVMRKVSWSSEKGWENSD